MGGKLRSAEVAGHAVDVGAESMLARRPEGTGLATELGLEADLTHPNPVPAAVWSRGRRQPLPGGTVMGVPTEPATAAGVLTPEEVARAADERVGPPLVEDVSVGRFVEDRVGPAVVDRLVEPLLAGVYAGHAHATLPAGDGSRALGGGQRRNADRGAAGVDRHGRAGLRRLPRGARRARGRRWRGVLAARGVEIRTGATVRELARRPGGWRLTVGPTISAEQLDVDGVVLAVPATPAARLLRATAPSAAALLDAVEYASVAIVTLALPRSAASRLDGSGFLVPPVEPLTIKAATFSSTKWAWLDEAASDVVLLRASLGRAGEVEVLQRDDADLVETVVADLRTVLGDLPAPVDAHVQRWGGALPQYAVGHLARVQSVLDAAATLPGLGLAGAAYEGVGIPACVASGRRAAREVLASLRQPQ